MLFWCETVAMAPHRFDDVGAKLAPELIDHAGDPRPAGVIGVRRNSLINLAGSEHLPRPAGQQEQNIKLHRRQVYHLAGLPHKPALRVYSQRAKEQRASAEAATVEKSATEARAVTVFTKMASSSSLKDRIINFPIFPHLLIFARIIYNHLFDLALYRPISHRYTSSNAPRLMLYILCFST